MQYLAMNLNRNLNITKQHNPQRCTFSLPLLENYKYKALTVEQRLLLLTLGALSAKYNNNVPFNPDEINHYGVWTDLKGDIDVLVKAEFYVINDTAMVSNPKAGNTNANFPDTVSRLLPSWLDLEAWNEFMAHRRDINKPASDLAITKLLNILEDNQDDQAAMINNSIQSRWTGLFPLKLGGKGNDVWESTYDNAFKQFD